MNTLREIVRTCSNAHVAQAAVASIGGDFARRFAARGADQPILTGLRHILDRGLSAGESKAKSLPAETPPAWAICASRAGVRRE